MNGHSDILIIGGGIGGMTAALYAARANLSVRIVEKEVCGGLVNWTHTVENVPSYKSIHGMDLMTACREHVESLGVAIEEVNEVEEVRLDGQPKEIRTSEGDSFTADVVIIATGRKPIPLPVETAFEKVHYCSVCDGTAYKDKDVLVVGGGNSGFDESLYLAGLGVRSVHIVEMFPACAAAQSTQDRALATGIIRANVNTTITALDPLPDGRCRASLRDTASGAEQSAASRISAPLRNGADGGTRRSLTGHVCLLSPTGPAALLSCRFRGANSCTVVPEHPQPSVPCGSCLPSG